MTSNVHIIKKKRIFKFVMYDRINILQKSQIKASLQTLMSESHFNTIGVSFLVWKKEYPPNNDLVYQIWNINENYRFSNVQSNHIKGSIGVLISFSYSNENAPREVMDLINNYLVLNKSDPLAIGLIGYNDLQVDPVMQEKVKEGMADLKYLISDEWGIPLFIHNMSMDETDFISLLSGIGDSILLQLAQGDSFITKKRHESLTMLIESLRNTYPNIAERLSLTKEGVVIHGKIRQYLIDSYGTSYLYSAGKQKYLCLVDDSTDSSYKYSISLQSLRDMMGENKYLVRPFMVLVIAKIFFLLNDDYYYGIDTIFRNQLS